MRQIKFRGRRLDNGKWVYGDLIENQGRFFIYHATSETTTKDSDDGHITVVAVAVDGSTVGQFTGRYDKNGREIYEGDIVRFPVNGPTEDTAVLKTSEVKWNKDLFRFTVLSELWRSEYCIIDGGRVGQMEVICNIHDNPELLKGGEE
jgi:uncharacterized phage protein (TIGR01671 family)|nr:MAG TPA: YopX protein [Caudoviricetes sp.]